MAQVIILNFGAQEHTTRTLGAYQIAYWVREHGMSCQVIDYSNYFTHEELIEVIETFIDKDTKVFAISKTYGFHNDSHFLETVDYIKKKHGLKFVVGGKGPPNKRLDKRADITIKGDGENEFIKYLYDVFDKTKHGPDGIRPFNIIRLEHRFAPEDLIMPGEVLPIELGRGCVFKCNFCSHPNIGRKKGEYQRNWKLIEEEIVYNYENFGITSYNFSDDTVNEDPEKIKFLGDMGERLNFDLQWQGYVRLDLLHRYPSMIEDLPRSKMKSAFFGIESFEPKPAASVGKGWIGKNGRDFVEELYLNKWNKEISIYLSMICGLPYENIDAMRETCDWFNSLPDIGQMRWNVLNLYNAKQYDEYNEYGTMSEFNRNADKYGYFMTEDGFTKRWYNTITGKSNMDCHYEGIELNKRIEPTNKISSWFLFEAHNAYGKPLDELRHVLNKDYKATWDPTRAVNRYKKKMFEYIGSKPKKLLSNKDNKFAQLPIGAKGSSKKKRYNIKEMLVDYE